MVVSVNGEDVASMTHDETVALIKASHAVTLRVARPQSSSTTTTTTTPPAPVATHGDVPPPAPPPAPPAADVVAKAPAKRATAGKGKEDAKPVAPKKVQDSGLHKPDEVESLGSGPTSLMVVAGIAGVSLLALLWMRTR